MAWLTVLSACLVPAMGNAQTAPSPAADSASNDSTGPAFQVTTELIQIDAVVTDGDGRHVIGLSAEDFEILQSGKRQEITHFDYVSTRERDADKDGVAAPSTVAPHLARPVQIDQRERITRTIVFVVDDTWMSLESFVGINKALTRFANEWMRPGDLVAVLRTSKDMGAAQQLTTDPAQIQLAIDQVRARASAIPSFTLPLGSRRSTRIPGDDAARLADFQEEVFTVGTLGKLNFLIRALAPMPGRKAIVLLSEAFAMSSRDWSNLRIRDALRRLVEDANRASVVIHTVGTGGIEGSLSRWGMAAESGGAGVVHGPPTMPSARSIRQDEGLRYLARETGGLYEGLNYIDDSVKRINGDEQGYYLIGYRPDRATFRKDADGYSDHELKVRVRRRGLRVRTRRGFWGVTDEAIARAFRTPRETMINAAVSPFTTQDIAVGATILPLPFTRPKPLLRSLVRIDGRDLLFQPAGGGNHEAQLEVLAVTFGDNGTVVDETRHTINVRDRGESDAGLHDRGFVLRVDHELSKPGAYQFRVAVRDRRSGRLGTTGQFIAVPKPEDGGMSISGLVLSAEPVAAGGDEAIALLLEPRHQEPAWSAALGAASGPSERRFSSGSTLSYRLGVAVPDWAIEGRLDVSTRVYRGDDVVLVDENRPLDSGGVRSVAGCLKLPDDLAPGEYWLAVRVRIAAGKRTAEGVSAGEFEIRGSREL